MKLKTFFIFQFSFFFLLTACNQNAGNEDSATRDSVPTVIGPDTTVVTQQEDASAPVAEKKSEARSATRPTTKKSTTQTAKQPVTQAAKQSGSQATKQTIYVETYGAQGKVWGHVTLNGDRGSGTIHDVDENTLSVTVTRHGNELFAVDQNSRQYVFKIKN